METEESQQLSTGLLKAAQFIKDHLTVANDQQKSMRERAHIAKNQIQDDVTFHLELLRNREVWLLEQVDVLLQLKHELMDSYQNDLHVLLAKIEVYLELVKSPKFGESPEIATEVGEILSRVQAESLDIEESADINFVVNNFTLSDTIKNFGNVVEGMPHFSQKSETKSQSLLLVQEHFKRVQNSPTSDWLVPSPCSVLEQVLGVTSEFQKGIQEFYHELQQTDNSDWLYEEHQPMDMETVTDGFTKRFQEVWETPLTDWLVSGHVVATSSEPAVDKPARFIPFDTSEGLETWLRIPEGFTGNLPGQDEENSDESSGVEMIDENEAGGNEWLLNRNSRNENPVSLEPVNKKNLDSQVWLVSCDDFESDITQISHDESWLQRFRESVGKSTSDWLIVSSYEPEYCEWLTRESIERCKNCPGECARDTFKACRSIFDSSRSEWLATAKDW